MANLSFSDKDKFERLFNMGGGYILDFNNREFKELVFMVIGIDIYSIYTGLSKAKILREIIKSYDNIMVGKLLLEIMEYQQSNGLINDTKLFNECAAIGQRLIGKSPEQRVKKENIEVSEDKLKKIDYEKYTRMLLELSRQNDTPQSRGYSFERFLYDIFEANSLSPRGSFKLKGEQIDGSFILHNEIYLLEAKWTNKPIDKGELVIFNEKVSSKSGFTRGLFISFSGYTTDALETFSNGRKISIVLMTVQELVIMLERKIPLDKVIWDKVRSLGEEGNYFKSI